MSSDVAIRAEQLSKSYRLGEVGRHSSLREAWRHWAAAPWRRWWHTAGPEPANGDRQGELLWALRDVSFEVKPGEVLGVIGRNGAGKSTLLKILTRITHPTSGRAEIRGRVGSLLEVGTGFHPELTGRENIFLNGAILGMTRAEIRRKFDAIVAFSGVEQFLDTPVKRYSSGMRVRLAFAVAAHLEPEILLIDEVLAVGDAEFQKKCLGKMGEVARGGRTILFVSHNLVAMQQLCQRVLWLEQGSLHREGNAGEVVLEYLSCHQSSVKARSWSSPEEAPGNAIVRLRRVAIRPVDGDVSDPITMETPLVLEVEYWQCAEAVDLAVTALFCTPEGIVAFGTSTLETALSHGPTAAGLYRACCQIPGNLLNAGPLRLRLLLVRDGAQILWEEEGLVAFEVLDTSERRGHWFGKRAGVVRPQLPWARERLLPLPQQS